MVSRITSTPAGALSPMVNTDADKSFQISASRNGFLIKGDITQFTGLKDFATWNAQLGAWSISRKRAYECDHHYGVRLFSR